MVKNNHIIEEKNADKALVLSTGEIFNIKTKYLTFKINISFPFESDETKDISDKIEMEPYKIYDMEEKDESAMYILENGISYKEKELIVGSSNIREFKIKNLLNGTK